MSTEVGIILGFSFSSFIFAYLSTTLDKKHGALQTLFLAFSLMMMIMNMSMVKDVALEDPNFGANASMLTVMDKGYLVAMYSLVIFLIYFFINLLWNALDRLNSYTK